MASRLSGISLSPVVIQRRLQPLRKRYRLEKISYLQSVVEGKQAAFISGFEHYTEMECLHKHIDPYVCAVRRKIFENLVGHQIHVQSNCEVKKLGNAKNQEMGKRIKEGLNEEKKLATEHSVDFLKENLKVPQWTMMPKA
nr:uncharacterized protein LOC120285628 [Drosophila simulans]